MFRWRSSLLDLICAPLVALVLMWSLSLYWDQLNDDAFITFRYSLNLAAGVGPYFNSHEQVEGYTNFLQMVLLAPVIAMGGPGAALPAAKIFNALGAALACVCAAGLVRRWIGGSETLRDVVALPAWGAAAPVAVNAGFALNTTTGLETASFAGLLMLGLLLVQIGNDCERWRGAGIAFALAALARPEGVLAFAAVWVGRVAAVEWRSRPGRRRLLWDAALVGGVVLAQLLLRMTLYDGELLPNTYHAKAGGENWIATAITYTLGYLFDNLGLLVPLLGLCVLALPKPLDRTQTFPALALVLAGLVGSLSTGAGWMPGYRLLQPYTPIWAALAAAGLVALLLRVPARARLLTPVGVVGLVVFSFGWQSPNRAAHVVYSEVRTAGYRNGHLRVAEYLRARTEPGDVIALMDIGMISYALPDRVILDITGLTDRFIAKSPGGFLAKRFDPAYVFDHKPRYIVFAVTAPQGALARGEYQQLHAWTPIEERLIDTPAFRANYVSLPDGLPPLPPPAAPRAARLAHLAQALGSAAVFEHDYPGPLYLLVVYERQASAPASNES